MHNVVAGLTEHWITLPKVASGTQAVVLTVLFIIPSSGRGHVAVLCPVKGKKAWGVSTTAELGTNSPVFLAHTPRMVSAA